MGKNTGFMEFERGKAPYRDPLERVGDWEEFVLPMADDSLREQGARCMDCGIPFCHTGVPMGKGPGASGCPLNNLIPDWNDLVYRNHWKEALQQLAQNQQLSRVYRTRLPRPLRGLLRPGHQRKPGDHQDHRVRDRRPRFRGRLDPARTPASADRKESGRHRIRSRRPGLRSPVKPRRPPCNGI